MYNVLQQLGLIETKMKRDVEERAQRGNYTREKTGNSAGEEKETGVRRRTKQELRRETCRTFTSLHA